MGSKAIRWGYMCGLIVLSGQLCRPCNVLAETHIFSAPDGRATEAEIVNYDSNSGRITLERNDGQRVKVSPSAFVEIDQQYIQEWITANAFLSDQILKADCDDRVVKDWKVEEKANIRYAGGMMENDFIHNVIKYEEIAYDFTFQNRGAAPIKGLKLEYCIYYEQSSMTRQTKPEPVLKTLFDTIDLLNIAGGQAITVSTKSVLIYEDDINPFPQNGGDQRRPGKGEVIGIRARLIMEVGNNESVRELVQPESLSDEEYAWTTKTSRLERKPSFKW